MRKYIFAFIAGITILVACKKDDDAGEQPVPPRDRGEQQKTDDALIVEYLKTHYYTLEDVFLDDDGIADYQIVKLHNITNSNEQQSIKDSPNYKEYTIKKEGVDYKLYVLEIDKGKGTHQPSIADFTTVTYRGQLLSGDNKLFDSAITQTELSQVGVIDGWREALLGFKGAPESGIHINSDGTLRVKDYGHLVVFVPSGLAYFSSAPSGIPQYSSLIFNIQLRSVKQADHDNDGIPSYLEDINENKILLGDLEDNTDGDNALNYLDADDDGDGTPTRNEIKVEDRNSNGFIEKDEITFYDDDGDGIKNHLDADDRDIKNK